MFENFFYVLCVCVCVCVNKKQAEARGGNEPFMKDKEANEGQVIQER